MQFLDLWSRHETIRIVDRASVGGCFREVAGASQVVFDKSTIRECAIDKPTIGKGAAPKDAIRKFTVDEIGSGEQAPVPIDVGKRTSHEIRANDLSFNRKIPEFAKFEMALVPLNFDEIAFVNGL